MKKIFRKIEIGNELYSTTIYSLLAVELFYTAVIKGSAFFLVLAGLAAIPALYFMFVDTDE